jgi:hypothetical protein
MFGGPPDTFLVILDFLPDQQPGLRFSGFLAPVSIRYIANDGLGARLDVHLANIDGLTPPPTMIIERLDQVSGA